MFATFLVTAFQAIALLRTPSQVDNYTEEKLMADQILETCQALVRYFTCLVAGARNIHIRLLADAN